MHAVKYDSTNATQPGLPKSAFFQHLTEFHGRISSFSSCFPGWFLVWHRCSCWCCLRVADIPSPSGNPCCSMNINLLSFLINKISLWNHTAQKLLSNGLDFLLEVPSLHHQCSRMGAFSGILTMERSLQSFLLGSLSLYPFPPRFFLLGLKAGSVWLPRVAFLGGRAEETEKKSPAGGFPGTSCPQETGSISRGVIKHKLLSTLRMETCIL